MRVRLPRFGLRSLFLLTLAAALGLTWYTRPVPIDTPFADGALLRHYVRRLPDGSVADSQYVLLDAHGRPLCRGTLSEGLPNGTWTLRHPDGRTALSGPCRNGGRTGTWTVWDRAGRTSLVPHADPLLTLREAVENTHYRIVPDPREVQAVREGHARLVRDGRTVDVTFVADSVPSEPVSDAAALADVARQLASDDFETVTRTLPHVLRLGGEAAPHLVPLLRSQDAIRRRSALETLTQLGPAASAVLADVRSLLDDPEERVQWAALRAALALESEPAARDALVRRMLRFLVDTQIGRSTYTAARIAELASLGPAVFPALSDSLDEREPLAERFVAVAALGVMLQDMNPERPYRPGPVSARLNQRPDPADHRLYEWRQVVQRRPEFRNRALRQALAEALERVSRSSDEHLAAAAEQFMALQLSF